MMGEFQESLESLRRANSDLLRQAQGNGCGRAVTPNAATMRAGLAPSTPPALQRQVLFLLVCRPDASEELGARRRSGPFGQAGSGEAVNDDAT